MLLLQCHPSSGNRSLGIFNVLMSWPGFDMKSSLLAQVVKLEEGFRKGKDKSKSGRSYETGKGKGKEERDKGKGKYGGKQGGKQGGQQTHEGKGKGVSNKASQKGACFTCGRPGHLARDCWQNWQGNVRYVQNAHAEQSNPGIQEVTLQLNHSRIFLRMRLQVHRGLEPFFLHELHNHLHQVKPAPPKVLWLRI